MPKVADQYICVINIRICQIFSFQTCLRFSQDFPSHHFEPKISNSKKLFFNAADYSSVTLIQRCEQFPFRRHMNQVHTKPGGDCAEGGDGGDQPTNQSDQVTQCSISPIFSPYCLTPLHFAEPYVISCPPVS